MQLLLTVTRCNKLWSCPCAHHEGIWGSGGTVPLILNFTEGNKILQTVKLSMCTPWRQMREQGLAPLILNFTENDWILQAVKLYVCTPWRHMEEWIIVPVIPNHDISWKWAVSATPRPPYPCGNSSWYPLCGKQVAGWTQRPGIDTLAKSKISCPCWELNHNSLVVQLIG